MGSEKGQPALVAPGRGSDVVSIVGQQFCVRNCDNLAITVSSRSRDGFRGFIVSQADGAVSLRVKVKSGGFFSRPKQLVEDTSGNTIVTLQAKSSSWCYRQCAFRGNTTDPKDLLFSAKMSSRFRWKTTEFDVFLATNTAEKAPDFKVECRSGLKECTFYSATDGSRTSPIARITKDKKPFQLCGSVKDSWRVELAPQVDYAFVVTIFVMLVMIAAASSSSAGTSAAAAANAGASAGAGC